MNWFKKIFQKKPVHRYDADEDKFMPLVTEKEGQTFSVMDSEGSAWTVSRSGDIVYLSGDDGLVQAQFDFETFMVFLAMVSGDFRE